MGIEGSYIKVSRRLLSPKLRNAAVIDNHLSG
jgi:hypothetical protein